MTPEALQARILYRDADILIIDKPAGLAVHAGPKTGQDLEALLPALRLDGREVPKLAHRLDTDTSGCLVLARHAKALTRLGRAFSGRDVEKTYWAVVEGGPEADLGRIDLPLKKLNDRSGWRIVVDPAGLPAVTDFRVLGRGAGFAWLELKPETGRTHQLRVHAREAGWPMAGDPFYGSGKTADRPLHLMARRIALPPLGQNRPAASAEAPPPAHMRALLEGCGWQA
jgi:tRNA pseudouridine32 synthase / 23S rRNA pseudouridine746 synthase